MTQLIWSYTQIVSRYGVQIWKSFCIIHLYNNVFHVQVVIIVCYSVCWTCIPAIAISYQVICQGTRIYSFSFISIFSTMFVCSPISFILLQNYLTIAVAHQFLDVLHWQLKQGLKGGVSSAQSPTFDDSWFTDDSFLKYHYKVRVPLSNIWLFHSTSWNVSLQFLHDTNLRGGINAGKQATCVLLGTC